MKKFLLILSAIVLAGAGCSKPATKTTVKTPAPKDNVSGTQALPDNTTITSSCGDMECIGKKFATCSSAKLTITMPYGAITYEILGPEADKCKLKISADSQTSGFLAGKEMTCLLNYKEDFNDASKNLFTPGTDGAKPVCTGSMIDQINSYKTK